MVENDLSVYACDLQCTYLTHSQLSNETLNAAGISQGTIRLSIGLENKEDLLADLLQAIEKAKSVD